MPDPSAPTPSPVERFRELYANDRALRKVQTLSSYLRLCPGDDNAVAKDFLDSEEGRSDRMDATSDRWSVSTGSDPLNPTRERRIGHFLIEAEVGRGGQGIVFRAMDTRRGRRVALKVLSRIGTDSEESIERFRREAAAASKLEHPGICTVYEAGVSGGAAWIAMPFITGETLAQRIGSMRAAGAGEGHQNLMPATKASPSGPAGAAGASGTAITPGKQRPTPAPSTPSDRRGQKELLGIMESAARALHAAHEAGVLHRDIKPGNIMVAADGRAILLDFGIARIEGEEFPTLTGTGELFGTPAYISPEQLAAHRIQLDRRTDVWSLGVCLYEVLTLVRPFEGPTREALYQAVMTREPERIRRLNPAIPKDLAVVVETALQKDRDRRYLNAAALADDLKAVLEGRPIAARPVGPIGRLVRWSKREPAKAALVAVLLVGLPTVAVLVTQHMADRPRLARQRDAEIEEQKQALVSKGYFELGEGDPARAVSVFGKALALDGHAPEAVGGIVLAQLKMERPADALATLDAQGAQLGAGRAAALLRRDALVMAGRRDDAAHLVVPELRTSDTLECYLEGQTQLRAGRAGSDPAFVAAVVSLRSAALLSDAPRALFFEQLACAASFAHDATAAREAVAVLCLRWPQSAEAAFFRGLALDGIDENDGAIAAYRQAIQLDPHWAAAWSNLCLVLRAKGSVDEAIAAAREAIRLDPHMAEGPCNLGLCFQTKGSFEESIAAYHDALRIDPQLAEAHMGLGITLHRKGDTDAALVELREAVKIKPGYAHAHMNLGNALRAAGSFASAAAEYRTAIKLRPEDHEATYNLGCALLDAHDVPGAALAFREAIHRNADHFGGHYGLGLTLAMQGNLPAAIAEYREAVRLKPERAASHLTLAGALLDTGNAVGAMPAFREAIRLRPDNPAAHGGLGDACLRSNDLPAAIAAYREAIKLKPDVCDFHNHLGMALRRSGDVDGALAEHREAIRLDPEDPDGHLNLANALASADNLPGAEASYREAIQLKPAQPYAHFGLGNLLRATGDLTGAVSELAQAQGVAPAALADGHFKLGAALQTKGLLDEAIASYRQALTLNPARADAQAALDSALTEAGRAAETRPADRRP